MMPRAAMDAAHAAAVMVRAHGPDPKGRKMRKHAFFQAEAGDTTLSASGFLALRTSAAGSPVVVVTCASIVEPFLSQPAFGALPGEARDSAKLTPGAEVDVLMEVLESNSSGKECPSQRWVAAHLDCVVDIPAAGEALQMLLDMHGGAVDGAWEVGWALAPVESTSPLLGQNTTVVEWKPSRSLATAFISPAPNAVKGDSLSVTATRVAILGLSESFAESVSVGHEREKSSKVCADLAVSSSLKRGEFLLVVGSPFGALSPMHFHNSLSAGVVSNCWPPRTSPVALLMADIRCLPGMEGGPVFDSHGALVGMLTRPLRQRGSAAEVQLVITSAVLAPPLHLSGVAIGVPVMQPALSICPDGVHKKWPQDATSSLNADPCGGIIPTLPPDDESIPLVSPALSQALNSVVLVTIGDGAWASGVIISSSGLILTNAHILEPWRFGKLASSNRQTVLSKCDNSEVKKGCDVYSSNGNDFKAQITPSEASVNSVEVKWRGYQRIRVRLNRPQLYSWHNAEVIYVSQGPLDVAVLRLIAPPRDLCPIIPEESCPQPGSAAVVIGHGLFGPRVGLSPSVSAGVVARVVKVELPAQSGASCEAFPAMIQTTAAVHPGGSGGAVVNSKGRMIGLVTSNARHSGGSVIPFLNFSVPFGPLAPVFNFATKDGADLAILLELEKPHKFLSAVWAVVPSTPSHHFSQLLPNPLKREIGPPLLASPLDGQKNLPEDLRKFSAANTEHAFRRLPLSGNILSVSQRLVDSSARSTWLTPPLYSSL